MLSNIRLSSITLLCTFVLSFFSIQPTSAAEQQEASGIEQQTVFYYTVKKGDTLWDISNHFFGSPLVWPNLWSKNRQILNPHLIYPGNRLRIYKKDGMVMIEQVTEEEPAPVVEPVKEEAPAVIQEPSPPPEPVEVATEVEKELPFILYEKIDSVGFIREEPVEASAYIFSIKGEKTMISEDDIVYLKQEKDVTHTLVPGTLYTVFEILEDPVKDKVSNDYIGMQHNIKGILEITEILQLNPVVAEGRVKTAFQEMKIGDLLMPYQRRSPKITLSQSPEGIDGKILVTKRHDAIFADNTIAFMNKGEQDGIQRGQKYSIYYEESPNEVVKKIDIGSLIVLHTEKTTATVLVTDSDKELEPGVKIRTPLK